MPCRNNERAIPERVRFWRHVNKSGPVVREGLTPCWLWTAALTSSGYGVIGRSGTGRGNIRAHRLSYCIANDLDESDLGSLLVMHACDNRICVNPEHLSLGTVRDNSRDMVERGRQCLRRGMANKWAKLTEDQVRAIRAEYVPGVFGQKRLARRYGVDSRIIARILKRADWAHVA